MDTPLNIPPQPSTHATPATPATPAPASPGPVQALTPEQLKEIRDAEQRAKKIKAAATVANFNGWCLAATAGLSFLFTVGPIPFTGSVDPISVCVTIVLVVLARNEFKGRMGLLSFDPRAATLLGRNQLGIIAAVLCYCAWMIYSKVYNPSAESIKMVALYEEAMPGFDMQGINDALYWAVYGSVAIATMIVQGFNAAYYFRRHKMIQLYHYHTPDWVIEIKRAGPIR